MVDYHKLESEKPREIPVEGPLSCNPQSIERQMVGTLDEAPARVRTSDHIAHSTMFRVSPCICLFLPRQPLHFELKITVVALNNYLPNQS